MSLMLVLAGIVLLMALSCLVMVPIAVAEHHRLCAPGYRDTDSRDGAPPIQPADSAGVVASFHGRFAGF